MPDRPLRTSVLVTVTGLPPLLLATMPKRKPAVTAVLVTLMPPVPPDTWIAPDPLPSAVTLLLRTTVVPAPGDTRPGVMRMALAPLPLATIVSLVTLIAGAVPVWPLALGSTRMPCALVPAVVMVPLTIVVPVSEEAKTPDALVPLVDRVPLVTLTSLPELARMPTPLLPSTRVSVARTVVPSLEEATMPPPPLVVRAVARPLSTVTVPP